MPDNTPENLRKFLKSDDPAMVRMGISMAKGVDTKITVEDLGHFLESEEIERIIMGIALAEEAGIEEEALGFFARTLNGLVEMGPKFMTTTDDPGHHEEIFEILVSIAEDEKYTDRITDMFAEFIEELFYSEKRSRETEWIYDDALTTLGNICDESLRDKYTDLLVSGAFREARGFEGYPESDLNYTCMQILSEWGKNDDLIANSYDHLCDQIHDGQPWPRGELEESILDYCGTSKEEILEGIPWEEAYIMLSRGYAGKDGPYDPGFEENYDERPEWTVSTLKTCLRKSKNKKFREEAREALEELGIDDT